MRLASHTHGSVIPWNNLNFIIIIIIIWFILLAISNLAFLDTI